MVRLDTDASELDGIRKLHKLRYLLARNATSLELFDDLDSRLCGNDGIIGWIPPRGLSSLAGMTESSSG